MEYDGPWWKLRLHRSLRSGLRTLSREQHLGVALVAAVSWLVLFVIGYTVHAKPYEELLKEPRDISSRQLVGAVVMFALSSIPTNVLLLSICSGVLGTALGHSVARERRRGQPFRTDYTFGLTGAFVTYLLILAGFLTLTVSDTMAEETAEKQIKLAAIGSLFAFVIAYDHSLIPRLLRRVAEVFEVQVSNQAQAEQQVNIEGEDTGHGHTGEPNQTTGHASRQPPAATEQPVMTTLGTSLPSPPQRKPLPRGLSSTRAAPNSV